MFHFGFKSSPTILNYMLDLKKQIFLGLLLITNSSDTVFHNTEDYDKQIFIQHCWMINSSDAVFHHMQDFNAHEKIFIRHHLITILFVIFQFSSRDHTSDNQPVFLLADHGTNFLMINLLGILCTSNNSLFFSLFLSLLQ